VRLLDAALCPLKGMSPKTWTFVVIRENTEAYTVMLVAYSSRARTDEVAVQGRHQYAQGCGAHYSLRFEYCELLRKKVDAHRVSACCCVTSRMP